MASSNNKVRARTSGVLETYKSPRSHWNPQTTTRAQGADGVLARRPSPGNSLAKAEGTQAKRPGMTRTLFRNLTALFKQEARQHRRLRSWLARLLHALQQVWALFTKSCLESLRLHCQALQQRTSKKLSIHPSSKSASEKMPSAAPSSSAAPSTCTRLPQLSARTLYADGRVNSHLKMKRDIAGARGILTTETCSGANGILKQ